MKKLVVPPATKTSGLLSIGNEALNELSFWTFVRDMCLPLMPRTNATETSQALEICEKLAEADPGSTVELTDGAHELLCRAVSKVNLPGAVLMQVLPLMHAIFAAGV